MSEQGYNALLYWLSSQGQGSMEQFDRVCQTLKLPEKSAHIRRNLQLLGHIEVKPGAKKWSIAPPAWVQRPAGHPDESGWFLCGQRHASWAKHPDLQCQPQAHGPDLWWSPEPINVLTDIEIVSAGCTSEALLNHLDDIKTWSKQLNSSEPLRDPGLYQIECWDLETQAFKPTHNRAFDKRRYDDAGIYSFTRQGGRQDEIFIRYFHPKSSHQSPWLVADFIGLCFVNHYHQSMRQLGIRYNPATAELWVPLQQRWPFIYERCLILGYGLLPETVTGLEFEGLGHQWLYYRNVPVAFKQHLQDEILDARCIETKDSRYV